MRRTSKRVITAAVAAFLTISSLASAEVRPVVIGDDSGGSVAMYQMWYKRLKESGVPVRLRGLCDSACTFVLMLPHDQVCTEPTASLGFHLASYNEDSAPSLTGALIRRWYPEAARKWLVGQTLIDAPLYMPASVMVRLGIFPACEDQ